MTSWVTPKLFPTLLPGQVHVWRLRINQFLPRISFFSEVLSKEELDRAYKFLKPWHQQRFIIIHGVLRFLLASYLKTPPQTISFSTNEFGKPKVEGKNQSLEFNISHSHEIALLAFSADSKVGVDVELMRDNIETMEIAERFFSPAEREFIKNNQQPESFFKCWTAKEAYIKAIGEGLSRSLRDFSVNVENNLILDIKKNPIGNLVFLASEIGYAGALVTLEKNMRIWLFDYRDGTTV